MQENVADITDLIFSKVLIMVPNEKLFIETWRVVRNWW